MKRWTFDDIPDQRGRLAVVTGANSGIGFETARMLASKGAAVVLACRDTDKAEAARREIRTGAPKSDVAVEALDLADLESIASFAARFAKAHRTLDLLIANAGVMVPPLGRTRQGHELQFGTNHLGHFALTARLMPLLLRTPGSRIVVVSSVAQKMGSIDFDDLDWTRRVYAAWPAYGQSKLANMMFALELHRRLAATSARVRVTAAHPGWTSTALGRTSTLASVVGPLLGMKASQGALPTLRAATDPDAGSGSYWGPSGFQEMRGDPVEARIPFVARDTAVAARLFDESERLTKVRFALAS